jgi:hypothetical protein
MLPSHTAPFSCPLPRTITSSIDVCRTSTITAGETWIFFSLSFTETLLYSDPLLVHIAGLAMEDRRNALMTNYSPLVDMMLRGSSKEIFFPLPSILKSIPPLDV